MIELMIVVVIVSIIMVISISRFTSVSEASAIAEDMHNLSTFIKDKKLRAFTLKQDIRFTLNGSGNELSATLDPGGTATGDGSISIQNPMAITGGPLNINSRGVFTSAGNIHLATANNNAALSCIVISPTRVRLGAWNGTNCTAK